MIHPRIDIPDHWTPDQVDAAVELLELVLIDMWEQYELVLMQLRQHDGRDDDGDLDVACRERIEHDPDDDIPF